MQYVVIAMMDDRLEPRLADGTKQALAIDRKFREAGYERVTFTDGLRFFSRSELQDVSNA